MASLKTLVEPFGFGPWKLTDRKNQRKSIGLGKFSWTHSAHVGFRDPVEPFGVEIPDLRSLPNLGGAGGGLRPPPKEKEEAWLPEKRSAVGRQKAALFYDPGLEPDPRNFLWLKFGLPAEPRHRQGEISPSGPFGPFPRRKMPRPEPQCWRIEEKKAPKRDETVTKQTRVSSNRIFRLVEHDGIVGVCFEGTLLG